MHEFPISVTLCISHVNNAGIHISLLIFVWGNGKEKCASLANHAYNLLPIAVEALHDVPVEYILAIVDSNSFAPLANHAFSLMSVVV